MHIDGEHANYLAETAHTLAKTHLDAGLVSQRIERARPLVRLGSAFKDVFSSLAVLETNHLDRLRGIEWLEDNDYVIQEAIRLAEHAIPHAFYRQFPVLRAKRSTRVAVLAEQLLDTCGAPLDLQWVKHFLRAYQSKSTLSLGELWALPALLRLCVLERLLRRARELTADGATLSRAEQSAAIASHVLSLRHLANQDWLRFVEAVSVVHETLCRDPAAAYPNMDPHTRNRYRTAVEQMARRCQTDESTVATHTVDLCAAANHSSCARQSHVGYFLIDAGRSALAAQLAGHAVWQYAASDKLSAALPGLYLGLTAVMTLAGLAALIVLLRSVDVAWAPAMAFALVASPLLLGTVTSLINWAASIQRTPRVPPKLDFSDKIPAAWPTIIATPSMLSSPSEIDRLLQRMETNFLGNRDTELRYALLTDFLDAEREHTPTDADLVHRAEAGIEELNTRYPLTDGKRFWLVHRPRVWNENARGWMGWERKRGKLAMFNRLLLGDPSMRAHLLIGEPARAGKTRFVITLDADTQLPPGTAAELVATLAHPLNRPILDEASGRLTAGYSIVQPRLEVDPAVVNRNPFTRAFSGDVVVDLYSHATSDVYQDLFGVGMFAGKGIYDLHAFEATLDGRMPENAILSHDLLEGVHGRVALASDVVLFEDYPDNLLSYGRRQHRWARGDWQLLPWLRSKVPGPGGTRLDNCITLLDRFKVFDNMRRCFTAPALLIALIMSWLMLGSQALPLTLGLLALSAVPNALGFVHTLGAGIRRQRIAAHLAQHMAGFEVRLLRWLLMLISLPYETMIMLDAFLRSVTRLYVTHRNLLEWTPAARASSDVSAQFTRRYVARQMRSSPILAIAVGLAIMALAPDVIFIAGPFLIAWCIAPLVVFQTAIPRTPVQSPEFDAATQRRLRRITLRTWQFFEEFIGPENHWLPPDNYHESPSIFLARRTSPTNIGLLLLTTLGALDMGYKGLATTIARLEQTFLALLGLERYRGHFLNWYGLESLAPLEPRYVSTVDSGNLAASLIALRQGLIEARNEPLPIFSQRAGIEDILNELHERTCRSLAAESGLPMEIKLQIDEVRREGTVTQWLERLSRLESQFLPGLQGQLLDIVRDDQQRIAPEELGDLRRWVDRLRAQLQSAQRDIRTLLPWHAWPSQSLEDSPFAEGIARVTATFIEAPALGDIPGLCTTIAGATARLRAEVDTPAHAESERLRIAAEIDVLEAGLADARSAALALADRLDALATKCADLVREMDFAFLYDTDRHLLRLGYRVSSGEYDPNYYDLLASEARLASFVAIAKGDVPPEHWIYLGRPIARIARKRALVSWSATAFEYFMPHLMMRAPEESLITQSCRAAAMQQRRFAQRYRIPWGISESGFAQLDKHAHYQYRAFGVPGLGLRHDSSHRLVVAPYASVLAMPFTTLEAIDNIAQLERLGMLGRFGLFEAVDFGEATTGARARLQIVKSYMSHHQGMIMAALVNSLHNSPFVRRFHRDPYIASIEHLLHEGVPRTADTTIGWRKYAPPPMQDFAPVGVEGWSPDTPAAWPQYNVLANDRLQVVVSREGMVGSTWNGLTVTGSRSSVRVPQGACLYLKDLDSGAIWSAGRDPVDRRTAMGEASEAKVTFFPHKVEMHRRAHAVHLRMVITVPADEDAEVRRVTITNESDRPRRLKLISYAEPVLARAQEFERHPEFNKLFIETQVLTEAATVVAHRRPREPNDSPVYVAHMVTQFGSRLGKRSFYVDRSDFLGRGGSLQDPLALRSTSRSNDDIAGTSIDPLIGIGIEIDLPARAVGHMAFVLAVGANRSDVLAIVNSHRSSAHVEWAFQHSRLRSESVLAALALEPRAMRTAATLLSAVWARPPALRANAQILGTVTSIRSVLWSRGISGDRPILLCYLQGAEDLPTTNLLMRMHEYWARQHVAVDLVLVNREPSGYAHDTRSRIAHAIESSRTRRRKSDPSDVFLVCEDELSSDQLHRLIAGAWLVFDPANGSLDSHLALLNSMPNELPPFVPVPQSPSAQEPALEFERPTDLLFDNGIGGFTADGRAYVIWLEPGTHTPSPWVNVIANSQFGFLVSETGSMCTWAGNCGENRLTQWHNDPVVDPVSEMLFLRDEQNAAIWSTTPYLSSHPCRVEHGAGYSAFEQRSHGLDQIMTVYADTSDPVKIVQLSLTNHYPHTRRITATYFADWVLGTSRPGTSPYLVSEFDRDASALFVRNAFGNDSATAFVATSQPVHSITADRNEFLGTSGNRAPPAGLQRIGLSGRVQPGVDPCAAIQVHLDVPAGERVSLHFVMGEATDRASAERLAARYTTATAAGEALDRVHAFWRGVLGTSIVQTPDPAMDLMLNHWLQYQTLTCRVWARGAFYQAGGGIGFRDQLQDVLALLNTRPDLARAQILNAASVQFHDGDVLHWWHESPRRGIRTRCSDDFLWLPFATAHYVEVTRDFDILAERIPYLEGAPLSNGETEHYAEFDSSETDGSLYEHCRRALDHATKRGPHDLPLIGSGDWNDGLNRVGVKGRGESIWLAWFLAVTYRNFAPLCSRFDHTEAATVYERMADALIEAAERNGWDGQWYLRAYHDDGSTLGSAADDECRIDLNAQTWAVIAQSANRSHLQQAMASAESELIDWDRHLVRLLAPPFHTNDSAADPGYIKGYPPGVRENGAQYSHAATWAGWAYAILGDGDRAVRVFHALNPISHTDTADRARDYRIEPYVVAGDIYGVAPHIGRGGWSWYTGAAAWAYRLGMEAILGLTRRGPMLHINPCLPNHWPGFTATVRVGETCCRIEVLRSERDDTRLYVDDELQSVAAIDCSRSHGERHVRLELPRAPVGTIPAMASDKAIGQN